MNIPNDNNRYPLAITKEYLVPKYLSFTHELKDSYKRLVLELLLLLNIDCSKKRKLQQRHLESKLRTLELVIVNLINKTRLDTNQQVFISYRTQAFTDTHCSYRQFISVMSTLEKSGLIVRERGKKQTCPFDNKIWFYYSASLVTITPKFINLCCCIEISKLNFENFFNVCLPKYFVSARYASNLIQGKKYRGKKVEIRKLKATPEFHILNNEMKKINHFIEKQSIKNAEFYGLVRSFNFIDNVHYFNYGGRMQAIGNKNFQTLKKEERKKILINGQAVSEVDIKASHLSIFYGILRKQIQNEDPYEVNGLHRDIVKEWVNISLSNSKYCERWPVNTKIRLLEKGHDLKKLSAKNAGEIILETITILKYLKDDTGGWGFLQYAESSILVKTIIELNKLNITALPVHDSLIVQQKHVEIAKQTLSNVFFKQFNTRPRLE